MCWCSSLQGTSQDMTAEQPAVLDQRSLSPPPKSVHRESQPETDHVWHVHDPERGYQILRSAAERQIGTKTLTEFHRRVESETTHAARQLLAPLLISPGLPGSQVKSSRGWTHSYSCGGSKASSSARPHSLSPTNSKSSLSKPVFTCISCRPRCQAFPFPRVFKGNHLKRADTPQWCWNRLFSWNTSITATTSIMPNKLLI